MKYTLEDTEKLWERTELKFELAAGQIVPKESSEPLPDELLAYLLGPDFDLSVFQQENLSKMGASANHIKIIRQLNLLLASELDMSEFAHYVESLTVKKKVGICANPGHYHYRSENRKHESGRNGQQSGFHY